MDVPAMTGTPSLTVVAANSTIPNFGETNPANAASLAGPGESLLIMNREFIKALEDITDPMCFFWIKFFRSNVREHFSLRTWSLNQSILLS